MKNKPKNLSVEFDNKFADIIKSDELVDKLGSKLCDGLAIKLMSELGCDFVKKLVPYLEYELCDKLKGDLKNEK